MILQEITYTFYWGEGGQPIPATKQAPILKPDTEKPRSHLYNVKKAIG